MAQYKIRLKREYTRSGRQIKNLGGTVVIFYDGVASNVREEVADRARRQHYVDSVEEIPEPQQAGEEEGVVQTAVETAVDAAETTQEAVEQAVEEVSETVEEVTEAVVETVEETVEEVEEEIAEEPQVEVSESVVATTEETEDGVLTKEEIEALYEEHGTWKDVADYLDISTTTLKKYRDEVGL